MAEGVEAAGASSGIPSASDHGFTSHGGGPPAPGSHISNADPIPPPNPANSRKSTFDMSVDAIRAGGTRTPSLVFGHHKAAKHAVEFDEYFVGPRDMDRHSKIPYFLRLHGSVTPRMLLPLTMVGAWSTLLTCISKFVTPLGVSTLMLTVLGFVVGLALSFRSSSAYERYMDGRKSWATLSVQSRNLARWIWVHVEEREGELGKDDLLAKLTGINLILAFAVALKHKLRFEPFAHYPDIASLISHLDTLAHDATTPEVVIEKKKSPWKRMGEFLGLTIAASNPRKAIKRAQRPVGNLPNEILNYLSAYVEGITSNGTLKSPLVTGQIMTCLSNLTDVQASAERVLNTPLPVGYNILISQIVLLYVYLLPFQLYSSLGWVTIPGCIASAYIIIGLAAIGNELENPFGNDVNDLPLDQFCEELRRELDYLTRTPAPKLETFFWGSKSKYGDEKEMQAEDAAILRGENKVLWPLSEHGAVMWRHRSVEDIRSALRAKVIAAKPGSLQGEYITKPASKQSTLAGGGV